MKSIFTIICAFTIVSASVVSCNSDKPKEKIGAFSESKPYALLIKKERSYYQAERIVNRLSGKNLECYILPEEEEDGNWYDVVSSALKDSAEIQNYTNVLDSLHIKPVKALNYLALDSAKRIVVNRDDVKEIKKIAANEPQVPSAVKEMISKYPSNNMFYLQNLSVLSLTNKGIESTKDHKLDMPRGLKLSYLKKKGCSTFSTVIYKDNLFGDLVTLQVAKCKPSVKVQHASFVPTPTQNNGDALELCSEIGDLILETGNYKDESKDGFKVSAYKELVGYKVSLTDKNVQRNYYILTDADGEFIYMTQSTKESDADIIALLKEIGKTDGLVSYEEFYNSYYLMADNIIGKDEFLGYYLERLTSKYAKDRNNQKWARKMVGHWSTNYYYQNPSKGLIKIGVFDLLSGDKRREVYNQLYMKSNADGKYKRTIYGAPGAAIYYSGYNYYSGFYNYLSEVNFGYGQYIIAANGELNYGETDIIARLESMQFEQGGYYAFKESKKEKETGSDDSEL